MIDNGDFCPGCKKNQMPPWKTSSETARKCQECGLVEERKIRERGYYWIHSSYVPNSLQIGFWDGQLWSLCKSLQVPGFEVVIEVKGKVIEGEWK